MYIRVLTGGCKCWCCKTQATNTKYIRINFLNIFICSKCEYIRKDMNYRPDLYKIKDHQAYL